MKYCMPVSVFEALAADHATEKESAASAVRSAVAVAGAVCPATVIGPIPGAPVALPTVGAVPPKTIASPFTRSVPVDPFDRVVINNSTHQRAFVTPDPHVIAPEAASTVPDTPPHLARKVSVGVPVVECLPIPIIFRHRPSCIRFAGMVTFGKAMVSVVVFATAVASDVLQTIVSRQYCLLTDYLAWPGAKMRGRRLFGLRISEPTIGSVHSALSNTCVFAESPVTHRSAGLPDV